MIDGLVSSIVAAFPDMETFELADLETAVNAELQERYNKQRPITFCDCEACGILRGNASLGY